MTAEVALLNKTAVALAADSAMTLGRTGKTYPVNKLFALSRYHPVGIMIYNNAMFMDVPWETLIKMHRGSIKRDDPKPTTGHYADDLLKYVCDPKICTKEAETKNLIRIARDTYSSIREAASPAIHEAFNDKGRRSTRAESAAIRKTVEKRLADLQAAGESDSMKGAHAVRIAFDNRDKLDRCIDDEFRDFTLSQSLRKSLHRVFRLAMKSNRLSRGNSGIVVAGFGQDEMFPTLVEVTTDGVVGGRLKYAILRHTDIGRNEISATVIPFAQREMVFRFMEGVDPEFHSYLRRSTAHLLYQFGEEVLDALKLSNPKLLEELQRNAKTLADTHFDREAREFQRRNFINPVMGVVAHLPKEELAGMAEALVNLTSLKRRVSLEQETVGGPIDVAVISKGDGFVWIKRKHYFDASLNPSYFDRQSLETKGREAQ